MRKKNTIIYILSALLVCLLLTGCDSGNDNVSDTSRDGIDTTSTLPSDTTVPTDTTVVQPSDTDAPSDGTTADEASDTTLPGTGEAGTIVLPRVDF